MEYSIQKHQLLLDFANEAINSWETIVKEEMFINSNQFKIVECESQIDRRITSILKSVSVLQERMGGASHWDGSKFVISE